MHRFKPCWSFEYYGFRLCVCVSSAFSFMFVLVSLIWKGWEPEDEELKGLSHREDLGEGKGNCGQTILYENIYFQLKKRIFIVLSISHHHL